MSRVEDHDVRLARGFGGLQAEHAALDDFNSPGLFSTAAWFENLSRHGIESADALALLTVRERASGLSFCLPLQQRQGSRIAAFGSSLESLSNYYSSLYGPIGSDAACSVAACRSLLRYLRERGLDCDVIDLHPLDSDTAFFRNMALALAQEGYWVDRYFCFGNWHLAVAGRSFDAYENTLPSRLRNTIRRGRKKLDAAGNWSLAVHTEPGAALEHAIDAFEAIYRESWKQPEPFPDFIRGLCRTAAERGWLRLALLSIGGEPAAAQIWLKHRERALIFKLAHDERFKPFSAGSVLTASMMRHAIDVDHVEEVDYLTGDDAYKADWMSQRRERIGLVAFRRASVQGLSSAARHFGGRWWRRWQRGGAAAAAAATPPTPPAGTAASASIQPPGRPFASRANA